MLQLVWWPEHEELHYDDMCIAVEIVLQDSHLKYEQWLSCSTISTAIADLI